MKIRIQAVPNERSAFHKFGVEIDMEIFVFLAARAIGLSSIPTKDVKTCNFEAIFEGLVNIEVGFAYVEDLWLVLLPGAQAELVETTTRGGRILADDCKGFIEQQGIKLNGLYLLYRFFEYLQAFQNRRVWYLIAGLLNGLLYIIFIRLNIFANDFKVFRVACRVSQDITVNLRFAIFVENSYFSCLIILVEI